MSIDLSQLIKTRVIKGKEETSVIPCLAITLYSEITLGKLASALGEVIKKYLNFIPPKILQSCWVGDQMKKLTTQKINKDLKTFEKIPKYKEEFYLLYSQGEFGAPGTHGILVFADEFEEDNYDETNLLRIELPWNSAEGDQAEKILNFVADILDIFPFMAGSVGFGFSFHMFDRFARRQVNAMLSRYLGFDASAESCRLSMRGQSPTAHWINILSDNALEKLGGIYELENAIPNADIRVVKGGVMIRVAKFPPVADINIGAPDIGLLPDLARFLQATRFRMRKFRWAEPDEVDKWLKRFDDLESKDWNNR